MTGKMVVQIDTTGLPSWREKLAARLVILIYRAIGARVEVSRV